MADERRRLGKGLDSLIGAARDKSLDLTVIRQSGHRVQVVPVDSIEPNPYQPRREFEAGALNDLVQSLQDHGLMQPIVVRKVGPQFQLIAGERRWRASRELGWETLEAVVVQADDRRMLEWALVENLQREALGPLELARAFRQMIDEFQMTQEEVGRALGMSRPAVANTLRLLELPETIQARVSRGTLTAGAARALLALELAADQETLAQDTETRGLNVRQVEELVRLKKGRGPSSVVRRPVDPNLTALVNEMEEILGARVTVRGGLTKGQLVLHYHSGRELDRLVRRLRGDAPTFAPSDDDESGETLTV